MLTRTLSLMKRRHFIAAVAALLPTFRGLRSMAQDAPALTRDVFEGDFPPPNYGHTLDEIEADFKATGEPPACKLCGGIVKSATISFGQHMPEGEMDRAGRAALACDLFMAIGSSLVVYPAAGLPIDAKRNGAKLVILNRDPTELDYLADLVINAEIGPTLAKIVGVN